MNLNVQLLGPVEVACGNGAIGLGGPKPRALLAMLALDAGATVSTDRLIDGLWGEEPPATATKLIQVYVSHLRKAMTAAGADGVIATRGHGYQLAVDRAAVDATRFERLLAQGAARDALQLWRGSPLSDVSLEPFAAAEIRRLSELRSAAVEVAIDQDLDAGRHREVLPELESLLGQDPFRERLHAQRILALYRCGRQADALEAYREARATLINDVGVEPGPELRRLHDAILRQDSELDAEVASPRLRQPLDELAVRTSQERAQWRIAEDEFAAGVIELQERRERAAVPAATNGALLCPFKGLSVFDVEDAAVFFGRERLVADMVARLPGSRLMSVVGPSGSGKSSAVRAGLVPALAEGVLPGSSAWPWTIIRPGFRPSDALRAGLAELPPDSAALLFVDQFEETFTACADERERAAFIADLVRAARDPRRRILVVVAMRSDFYGECAAYPELSRMVEANAVLVGPMRRDELRRAIELPARRGGLQIEPALVDALISDVEGEPGALPLLSTALLELWQRSGVWQRPDDAWLRLSTYEEIGGVRGAVARLAEAAFTRLDPDQQERAKRVLLRLAGEGDVRLRVPLGELTGSQDVLSVLAADRLVTIGEGEVEVAHEALLREWPRLVTWLEEDAEGRRVHRHLTAAARDWDATGRDASDLYRGARLAAVTDWAGTHGEDLNDVERDFVAASQGADQAEVQAQRRTNRRLRILLSGVASLLVLALAAGALAVWQRGRADDNALVADARRLAAQALTKEGLDEALLLASAGVELHPVAETHSSLLSVLLRQPAALGEIRIGWPMTSVAVSPDQSMLAVGDERGDVNVYDARTRRPFDVEYRAPAVPEHVLFSPDSSQLAAVSTEQSTIVDLLDPRTGDLLKRLEMPELPQPQGWIVPSMMFHPNGRDLIVVQTERHEQIGRPSLLTRVNTVTGEILRSRRVGGAIGWSMAATPERDRLFLSSLRDDKTYEVDPDSLRVVRTFAAGGDYAAVSGDGRSLAVSTSRGSVRVIDLATGAIHTFDGRHETPGDMRLAFAPDGSSLVTAAGRGEILVWDVATGRIRERFTAHEDIVWSLAITGDSRTLYSAGGDGRIMLWDLAGDRRLDRRFDAGPKMTYWDTSPKGLAVSPDGTTIAVTQKDGSVDLLDAATLERGTTIDAYDARAFGVAFSPDGERLAVTGDYGKVVVVDVATGRRLRTFEPGPGTHLSQSVLFLPDGNRVVTGELPVGGFDTTGDVRIWDVETGKEVPFEMPLATPSLALSPDGRLVAGAGIDVPSQVRDLQTGELVASLETGDQARSVAFSPDGALLAVGHYGGSVVLVSTEDYEQVGQTMNGHRDRVTALEFSPDGRRLLSGGADGAVQLWNVATRNPIGSRLTIAPDTFVAATFARDGKSIFAVPHRGAGVRLDVRASAWERHACAVAGRSFTPTEWEQELPGRPFREVCAQP